MRALEDSKLNVELKPNTVGPLIESTVEMHKIQAIEKNLELEMEFEEGLECVCFRLEPNVFRVQVLGNLLSNAIKFSDPSSKVIVKLTGSGDWIDIHVIDSGIGIPADLLSHIFDVDKPTTRKITAGEKGTGFGMPLVKAFTESLEGKIKIESQARGEGIYSGTTVGLRVRLAESSLTELAQIA